MSFAAAIAAVAAEPEIARGLAGGREQPRQLGRAQQHHDDVVSLATQVARVARCRVLAAFQHESAVHDDRAVGKARRWG